MMVSWAWSWMSPGHLVGWQYGTVVSTAVSQHQRSSLWDSIITSEAFLNFETSSILTYCLLGFLLLQERVMFLLKGSTLSKSSFSQLPNVHIEPCKFILDHSSPVYITNLHKVIGKARAHGADVPAWYVKDWFDLNWLIIVTCICTNWTGYTWAGLGLISSGSVC